MKKSVSKESIIESIAKCDSIINKQIAKKAKLNAQLEQIKRSELLDAILASGKDINEIINLINQ